MTLALVALAVATLARIASQGLALVLEARTYQEQLQHEWAVRSCRLVLLENAERLLGDSDALFAEQGWPYPAERRASFEVGGTTYQALLSDEQAKLNLNLVHDLDPSQMLSLLSKSGRDRVVPLRRDAAVPPLRLDGTKRVYRSWGELVDLTRLSDSENAAEGLVAFARQYTVGDDQRLNVRRATDEALRHMTQLVLTAAEAEELVEQRLGHSGDVRSWLAQADIPSRRLVKLRRYFTDRSAAYSVWIWNTDGREVTMASVGLTRGARHPQVLRWP